MSPKAFPRPRQSAADARATWPYSRASRNSSRTPRGVWRRWKVLEQGETIIYGDGELIHMHCHAEIRDNIELVGRYLRGRPGRAFCHSCLAAVVGLEFDETRKAIYALRTTGQLTVLI